jgi:hypothetical protein
MSNDKPKYEGAPERTDAKNAYENLGADRTIEELQRVLSERWEDPPTLETLENWRQSEDWDAAAYAYDKGRLLAQGGRAELKRARAYFDRMPARVKLTKELDSLMASALTVEEPIVNGHGEILRSQGRRLTRRRPAALENLTKEKIERLIGLNRVRASLNSDSPPPAAANLRLDADVPQTVQVLGPEGLALVNQRFGEVLKSIADEQREERERRERAGLGGEEYEPRERTREEIEAELAELARAGLAELEEGEEDA